MQIVPGDLSPRDAQPVIAIAQVLIVSGVPPKVSSTDDEEKCMKSRFASHLLLLVSGRSGVPLESAALSYLYMKEPVQTRKAEEEPPPPILRRLSAGPLVAPAEERGPELTIAPHLPQAARPPLAPRARRAPPRPWA